MWNARLLSHTVSLTMLLAAEVGDRERTVRTLSVKCQRMESEVSELQAAVVDLAVDERIIESEKARVEMEGKKRQVCRPRLDYRKFFRVG